MGDLENFFESVKIAYSKGGGADWPARGKQISNSFIKLAALNQLRQLKEIRKRESDVEIAKLFWSTTQIRYILTGEFIVGLKICERDEKKPILAEITEYTLHLLNLLKLKTTEDPFCLNGKNKILSNSKVGELLESLTWRSSNKGVMRKAIASTTSMAWAFGYDTYFANCMEIHGPYDVEGNKQMIVREFKFDWVKEVWPETAKELPEKTKFYLIYENSNITIDWELHPESKTELVLEKYSALVTIKGKEKQLSDKELEEMVEKNTKLTSKQVAHVNSLQVLDKIRKGALLVYLQTKCLADALGENWKPGQEVYKAITEKGEENWNMPSTKPKDPTAIKNFWITIFDPRVPKD